MDINKNEIIFIFLVIGISLPGCDFEIDSNTSKISEIKKENSIVKSVEQKLTSKEVFQPSFFAEEVRKQIENSNREQRFLKNARDLFSKMKDFTFVDGVKFLGISNEPIIYPMKDETKEYPSMFRLLPKSSKQIYLIFSTDKQKISYKLHILLWPENGDWKVFSMRYFPFQSQMKYQLAIKKGKEEFMNGDKLVGRALFLYAEKISVTPKYRTSGKQRKLRAIKEKLAVDSDTNPIEKINIQGIEFDIVGIRPVLLTNGVFVELNCPFPDIKSDEKVKRFQGKIAQRVFSKHEKLQKYFQGIAVSSKFTDENGSSTGYRSLHKFEKLINEKETGD